MVKRNLSKDMDMAGPAKRTRVSKTSKAYIAKTAKQVVLRMAEKKRAMNTAIETLISSATQGDFWVALSNIDQGSASYQRVGKECHLQKLSVKGAIHNNSTGTHLVRMVVGYFLDQGVPGTGTEMFEAAIRAGAPQTFAQIKASGYELLAQSLPLNRAKFIPVVDSLIKVGANSSIDGNQVKTFSVTKSLRGQKIRFEQAGTGAANQDRQLYIGFWTAEGGNDVGAGTNVEVTFTAIVDYLDL